MTITDIQKGRTMKRIADLGQDINDRTDLLYIEVADAVDQGLLTWAEVGHCLGCTRQAAWERFTKARLRVDGVASTLQEEQLF